jgi:oxygen-independent coproporphyrinogen-3 oxidase
MLSLYVHIPFCVGKCLYCGFYSTPYTPGGADKFIRGLQIEAAVSGRVFADRIFNTVYLGGGTPTALSSDRLAHVIGTIRKRFQITNEAEFTVEANPNTVTRETLDLLIETGVNRLSLGVQSFSDEVLQSLGRPHTAELAAQALGLARDAGFTNTGIDLIYGVPGQVMHQWEETLDTALALGPAHVSAYSLSLDEGSSFHRKAEAGGYVLPDDEFVACMYECAVNKLRSAGYGRYEISNFSRPGFACRHNINYWERGEYLGLGPGAWSFISGRRHSTIANVTEYTRRLSIGSPVIEAEEVVDRESAAREAVLLGLRTMKGLDLLRFEREYGGDILRRLELNAVPVREAGLLQTSGGVLKLTDRGILLSNEALARLAI